MPRNCLRTLIETTEFLNIGETFVVIYGTFVIVLRLISRAIVIKNRHLVMTIPFQFLPFAPFPLTVGGGFMGSMMAYFAIRLFGHRQATGEPMSR